MLNGIADRTDVARSDRERMRDWERSGSILRTGEKASDSKREEARKVRTHISHTNNLDLVQETLRKITIIICFDKRKIYPKTIEYIITQNNPLIVKVCDDAVRRLVCVCMCVENRKRRKPWRSRIETSSSKSASVWSPSQCALVSRGNACVSVSTFAYQLKNHWNYQLTHTHIHTYTRTQTTTETLSSAETQTILSLMIMIIFCFVIHYTLFFQEEKRKSHFYNYYKQNKNKQTNGNYYIHLWEQIALPLFYITLKIK